MQLPSPTPIQPFPKRQILDSYKLKEFADDNFKFDENGRKLFKWVENTVGRGEIAPSEQMEESYSNSFENTVGKGENARNKHFLLFPQCFLHFLRTFCHFHQT